MPITQIDPYYRVGTATFAASTAVVGQGTAWLANVEPGDQIFNRLGQMAVVATVDSNTSLTLVAPFAGTVQSAQAYTIYRVPDSVRLENFNQRMINLLTGGNMLALAELDGTGGGKMIQLTGPGAAAAFDAKNLLAEAQIDGTGGNWLSYFTGIGAKARTALTAKARALIALSANADILQEIGAQPSDANLTAIAAVTTQPFGRSLLTGASASAVWSLLGANGTASSGWVKLPNGLIMQAGTTVVTTDANGGYPVLLPTSYPTLHRTALLCTGDASVNPARHDVISMPLHGINGKANGIVSGPVRVNWFSWGW